MWYGNPSCGPQENPTGVWDSNYKMVQHLEETEDQTSTDSTKYSNDGSVFSDAHVDQNATGKIDGADNFLGAGSSYVDVSDSASLDITGDFTLEAWVHITEFPGNTKVDDVICKAAYGMGIFNDGGNNEIVMEVVHDTRHSTTGVALTTGTWYYIVAVFDEDATDEVYTLSQRNSEIKYK